jgi:hypothetical protein
MFVMDRALRVVAVVCGVFPQSSTKSGGMGIRTPDIQLAKLALYQLSYTPIFRWVFARVRVGWNEK